MSRLAISSLLTLSVIFCFTNEFANAAALDFGVLSSDQVSRKMMESGNNNPQECDCVRFGIGLMHELGLKDLSEHTPEIRETVAQFLYDFYQPNSISSIKMNDRMAKRTQKYLTSCLDIMKNDHGERVQNDTVDLPLQDTIYDHYEKSSSSSSSKVETHLLTSHADSEPIKANDPEDEDPPLFRSGFVSAFPADVEKKEAEAEAPLDGNTNVNDFDDVEEEPTPKPIQYPINMPLTKPKPKFRNQQEYMGRNYYGNGFSSATHHQTSRSSSSSSSSSFNSQKTRGGKTVETSSLYHKEDCKTEECFRQRTYSVQRNVS